MEGTRSPPLPLSRSLPIAHVRARPSLPARLARWVAVSGTSSNAPVARSAAKKKREREKKDAARSRSEQSPAALPAT